MDLCCPIQGGRMEIFMDLKLKAKEECTYDAVSLGEVMLRLDPGEGRIRTARQFRGIQCNPGASQMLWHEDRGYHGVR